MEVVLYLNVVDVSRETGQEQGVRVHCERGRFQGKLAFSFMEDMLLLQATTTPKPRGLVTLEWIILTVVVEAISSGTNHLLACLLRENAMHIINS